MLVDDDPLPVLEVWPNGRVDREGLRGTRDRRDCLRHSETPCRSRITNRCLDIEAARALVDEELGERPTGPRRGSRTRDADCTRAYLTSGGSLQVTLYGPEVAAGSSLMARWSETGAPRSLVLEREQDVRSGACQEAERVDVVVPDPHTPVQAGGRRAVGAFAGEWPEERSCRDDVADPDGGNQGFDGRPSTLGVGDRHHGPTADNARVGDDAGDGGEHRAAES